MDSQIKILDLEDNELNTELLTTTLSDNGISCLVYRVTQEEEFLEALTKNKYDLILSDNSLPGFSGIDALQLSKQIQPGTPFVFISGTSNEDAAIEAMKFGAADYVLKHTLPKLGLTIKRVLREVEQTRELETANKQLKESEEKYRVITENSADAIFIAKQNGEYVYVNPAAASLIGYTEEELLGKSITALAPEDKTDEFKNLFQKVVNEGKFHSDIQLKKKNGEPIPVDLNAVILPNGFIYGSCRDITLRKKAEEEILNAKLKAEEMNRMKSYFLANMSHELRTPMVAIMGYAEILLNEISDAEQIRMLDGILEGASRLNATFQSILELSQIESSTLNLQTAPHPLTEIVKESIKPFFKMAAKKNLYIRTETLRENVLAEIDPFLFRSAVYQIIDNGIKFTRTGGVLIQTGTERIGRNLKALVRVTDTGVGISEENIQKIFGEFRQISEGFNRSFEGLGVGLSLSKKIIELMNGEINVSSTVGKGTSISLLLPLKMSEDQLKKEIAVRQRNVLPEVLPARTKGKHTVLIVEDNPLNSDILKIYLHNNYNVSEAANGISALALAARMHFDIILMDIHLGYGIDGIETMKRLRAIDRYAAVPVIAITAYVMNGDREKLLAEGFDDYLPKPFTKESINTLMIKFILKHNI